MHQYLFEIKQVHNCLLLLDITQVHILPFQVEWNEINAAWGQTALLLHSLARKVGLTFERLFSNQVG